MNAPTRFPTRRFLPVLSLAAAMLIALWGSVMAAQPQPFAQRATATPTSAATPTPAATPAASESEAATEVVTDTAESEAAAEDAAEAADEAGTGGSALAGGGTLSVELEELEEWNGIPVGFTDEGYPFLGDPAAPVVLVEWSDYLCPFCARHFLETKPLLIDEYVQTGKLRMVFRDYPIPSLHPTAQIGHVAAQCMGENGAAAYWAMHDVLFGFQNEWNRVPDPSVFLRGIASELGADMDAYDECIAEERMEERVAADMLEGSQRGFSGTPTFTFGGDAFTESYTLVGAYPVDSFRQWIDLMVEGEAPPQQAEPDAPQLPIWAREENLLSDPDNPGRNLYGDYMMGSDEAAVTFIEFADFQCPACALHANEVQPLINEEYIETGLIRWVFKHRPLSIHPLAPLASAAAVCAGDQGMFWEMHDLLYAEQATWSPDDDAWTKDDAEAEILTLAEDLELDTDLLDECMNSRDALEEVLYDLYDAEGIINSTPTFVVIFNGQGTLIDGSRPYDNFKQVIDSILEQVAQE